MRYADMTVKIVDGRDRTIATFAQEAPEQRAETVGRGYVTRWNERAAATRYRDDQERAHGFYVWDETGRLLAYG